MDRYSKASEVWFLLHKAEQLVINDEDYHPNVHQSISNCMDIVETLIHDIEFSGRGGLSAINQYDRDCY